MAPATKRKTKQKVTPAVAEEPTTTTIKIGETDYTLVNANPVITSKLRAKYKRSIDCKEFIPRQKQQLIKDIIGPYAIKHLKERAKFYKLDYLTARVNALMKFYIYDIDATVGSIFSKLKEAGIKIFLHGGCVRDLLMGVRSADIDIIFDRDIQSIKPLCEKYKWPCSVFMVKEQYINFGINKGDGLEGSNLSKTFMTPLFQHEASVNDLAYDLQNDILIDVTGFGLEDIAKGQFRLGATRTDWVKWAKTDAKRPFRYFKLIEKGFKPLNKELHEFVINYIRDNWEKIYNRPISKKYPISWIKQILIKTITQGDIDETTGEYKFGPTEYKLMPFLQIIKKNVGEDIFMKIMANFTEADLKHFRELRIITSETQYINYKKMLAQQLKLKPTPATTHSGSKTKKVKLVAG